MLAIPLLGLLVTIVAGLIFGLLTIGWVFGLGFELSSYKLNVHKLLIQYILVIITGLVVFEVVFTSLKKSDHKSSVFLLFKSIVSVVISFSFTFFDLLLEIKWLVFYLKLRS